MPSSSSTAVQAAPNPSPPGIEDDFAFEDDEQVSCVMPAQLRDLKGADYRAQYRRLQDLLARGRFEEALDLLCSVREAFPDDQALSRSIRLLRDHLSTRYAQRLDDLDVVPRVAQRHGALTPHELRVVDLVDGATCLGELLLSSPLSQFDTLRALYSLLQGGVIVDDIVASASRRPPPSDTAIPPTPTDVPRLLSSLTELDGFCGAALVDSESGAVFGSFGQANGTVERAAVLYGELFSVERRAHQELGLEAPEDLIITRPGEYHLLRPLHERPEVFLYLVTQRRGTNLVLTRLALAELGVEVGAALGPRVG